MWTWLPASLVPVCYVLSSHYIIAWLLHRCLPAPALLPACSCLRTLGFIGHLSKFFLYTAGNALERLIAFLLGVCLLCCQLPALLRHHLLALLLPSFCLDVAACCSLVAFLYPWCLHAMLPPVCYSTACLLCCLYATILPLHRRPAFTVPACRCAAGLLICCRHHHRRRPVIVHQCPCRASTFLFI